MIGCQQALLKTLKVAENEDKKSLHNANKTFEELVNEARRIKKKRNEDIQKAQETIELMDEIIRICDEHRKKIKQAECKPSASSRRACHLA